MKEKDIYRIHNLRKKKGVECVDYKAQDERNIRLKMKEMHGIITKTSNGRRFQLQNSQLLTVSLQT